MRVTMRGLTLVELAVAVLVLSIGSIAAMRVLDQAARDAAGLEDRTLAAIVVKNRAAELSLMPTASLPAEVTLDGRTFTVTATREATLGGLARVDLRAVAEGSGAGAALSTYLPALP